PERPSNADLRRMLDGQLPAGEQGAAMGHVEACLQCQAALEQLTSCDDLFPTSGRRPSDLDRSTDEIVAAGETGGRSSPASTMRPRPLAAARGRTRSGTTGLAAFKDSGRGTPSG